MDSASLYALGVTLVFIGVLIIVVTLVLFSVSSARAAKFRGGGAVIIGPIPIIFGTDRKSLRTVLLLSLTLTVMLIVLIITRHLLFR
ncbi:MAG: TIGR00304 family membrane protein [Candidatus Bathyarchaeales archaeon]